MARRKNPPESVLLKTHVSERLREIRTELYGERGGPELARRLSIPMRTWYNYESGVTVPAEVILRFVELTNVEPMWLLHGRGPKFRVNFPSAETSDPPSTVSQLLRTALRKLEEHEAAKKRGLVDTDPFEPNSNGEESPDSIVLIGVDGQNTERLTSRSGTKYVAAKREWLKAKRDLRIIRIDDNAMSPLASDGAFVAYSEADEKPEDLHGKVVMAYHQGKFICRRFRHTGRFALLQAENPDFEPSTLLIDLNEDWDSWLVHRVLWIATPH